MSRHAETDDSSNEGSGTDSEEDHKADDGVSSRSDNSSDSDSGDETEETESRYMVQKNDPSDKRTRDDLAAVEPASKKLKTLAGGAAARPVIASKSDSHPKSAPGNRSLKPASGPAKKPTDPPPPPSKKPPAEPPSGRRKEPETATPKKTPQAWSSEDEIELISRILADMKTGIRPPKRGSRGDNYHYWGDLLEACRSKFVTDWSKEQLYDKYRRIKNRYDEMVKKERSEGITALKFKNPGEERVYKMWKEIYDMQEQDETEAAAPPNPKTEVNRKMRTPPPPKSKDHDEEPKRDVASSSKKAIKPPTPRQQEAKQNGSVGERQQQTPPPPPPPPGAERNLTLAAMNELQKKSNAALSEMQGKIDEIMSDFHSRSQGMIQEAVKGAGGKAEWLQEWLSFSMARGSSMMPLFGLEMIGGIGSGWIGGPLEGSSPAVMKLKEHWLKQQEDELKVMEQRVRLLQELCRHQQELLKSRAH